MLEIGVCEVDITPPIGCALAGFNSRIQPSVGILDPLKASVLVLAENPTKLALVSTDLISFKGDLADTLRQEIATELDIPPTHVLISCSHTHSGPSLGQHFRVEDKENPQAFQLANIERSYVAQLTASLRGAARAANASRVPGRMAWGVGHSDVGVNRRETLASGRVVIGRRHDGLRDSRVSVLRFDRLDGSPIATIVEYACHPILLGPGNRYISADYPGVVRSLLKEHTGVPCLFMQGCTGDQGPVAGVDVGPAVMQREGRRLAFEALKVFESLEEQYYDHQASIIESVAPLTKVERTLKEAPDISLAVEEKTVSLPLLNTPDVSELEEVIRRTEAELARLRSEGAEPWQLQVVGVHGEWADLMLERAKAEKLPAAVDVKLQVLRIGPVAIVALPVEPFVEIGLNIKEQSPAPHVVVVGYANGCAGYVPTEAEYPSGGYEVETSYKLYRLPAPISPQAATVLVDESLSMLRRLFQS